jgi:hypothetical protein
MFLKRRVIRAAAATAAASLSVAGAAAAQDAASYPSSLEREPLLSWLKTQTDITPDRVLAVTPQALTAVMSVLPAGEGPGPRLVIRAEALSAASFERTGVLSWRVSVETDCDGRRVRLGETTGHRSRNLAGGALVLRPAEADWRTPTRGTALESAWRAACDPDFRGPFRTTALNMAQLGSPAEKAAAPSATAEPLRRPRPAQARLVASQAAPREGRTDAGPVAQVGAVASEAEAKALLAKLSGQIGSRPHWVETATVRGRVWRRALVGGFADRADAARFCAALETSGGACFVRARNRR